MLKQRDKAVYAIGNLSNGVIIQALTTYLVFFGTTILGVSGTVIGFMVAISVVWDAVSDPFVGHLSDFTDSTRFGRRHQYMIIGAIGLAVFNGLLWLIDTSWPGLVKAIVLFVTVILVKTFMTVFVTPYNALGGELSDDYHERTSIQGYRTVFFILGLAFTTVAGMLFFFKATDTYPVGQLNPAGYANLGITISAIVLICAILATVGTFKYIPSLPKNTQSIEKKRLSSLVSEFKALFDKRNYLHVAGAYLSANIATAVFGAIGLHVFTYTFGMDNNGIAVLFAVIFGLSILSQLFWIDYAKRHDKKAAALMAVYISLAGVGIFIILLIVREAVLNQYLWLILYGVPTGVGLGGLITLPFSMIADTVDEDELVSGHRSEGLYYGGLTFSYKISQSIAIFLVGIVLDLLGFDSTLEVQSALTVYGMGAVVAVGSILALLGAMHFYKGYGLSKEKVDEIKKAIEKKRTSV